MTTRRLLAASAALLAAAACEPKIAQQAPPAAVTTAIFDPTTSQVPLPNDLATSALGLAGVPPGAQRELLEAFAAAGGFPNDQEVAITIGFARDLLNPDGTTTRTAPALDLSSFGPDTFFVYGITASGQGAVQLDPIQPADYAAVPAAGGGTEGVLTLHNQGRKPWPPGRYVVLVRGGTLGVRTTTGEAVNASPVFYLMAQGQDMTTQQNISLLRAQTGSNAAALALGQELNQLIQGYLPAYAIADTRFPHTELAVLATFTIAPTVTQVELDPGRGLVPLPIDLLRDPRPLDPTCPTCGKLTPVAACTLAGGTLDAAGNCSSAAAAGFAALDGFGTTSPVLAPTSDLVLTSTVTAGTAAAPGSLRLYDLTNPASPVLVDPMSYIAEPCEFAQSGLSPVIAVQPAGATSCDATSPFRTRPLKDNTSYAVVVTTDVKDKTGTAIGIGTVGKILLFDNPVSIAGKSQLQGIDDATAAGLEAMRLQLQPVLTASGLAKAQVAMAYTFKTQSILGTASLLASLPYGQPALTALPDPVSVLPTTTAFAKYGVDPSVPHANIAEVLETTITTFNLLDPATGAFLTDPTKAAPEKIHVLIARPQAAAAPACTNGLAPLACAPMMVFRHGLGEGRADMLLLADTFAAQGMVTVAIDAAKHGDRSYCTSGAATVNLPGVGAVPQCAVGTCQAILPVGAQGDAAPLGLCTTAGGTPGDGVPTYRPVAASCFVNPASCGWTGSEGIPVFSANYLVSANFFRTRDTFRQDIIDESQLVRAIAFVPAGAPPTGHPVFDYMATTGVVIDPAKVYYAGQSLGAIHGTMTVATNPRISKAVLNVGGGTAVDIFTTSPAFASGTNALLAGMGIGPGTSAYLQFLAVAKTILDPADPVNFAGHLLASTLPDFTSPTKAPQAPKKILTQMALCDQTVPNVWNYVWASNVGTSPLPGAPGFGPTGMGSSQLYFKMGATPPTPTEVAQAVAACAVPGATSPNQVSHGFITNWADATITAKAQADAAAFVVSDTQPASLVVLP